MKSYRVFMVFVSCVLSLALVGCATTNRTVMTDQDMANSIKNSLEAPTGPDGPFVIDIFVNKGNVTLDGSVPSTVAKEEAMDLAHNMSGVKDVKSFLRVK